MVQHELKWRKSRKAAKSEDDAPSKGTNANDEKEKSADGEAMGEYGDEGQKRKLPHLEHFHNRYLKDKPATGGGDESSKTSNGVGVDDSQQSCPRGLSTAKPEQQQKQQQQQPKILPENLPVPHMEHSGPKRVGVGQIGTISLLESIQVGYIGSLLITSSKTFVMLLFVIH